MKKFTLMSHGLEYMKTLAYTHTHTHACAMSNRKIRITKISKMKNAENYYDQSRIYYLLRTTHAVSTVANINSIRSAT